MSIRATLTSCGRAALALALVLAGAGAARAAGFVDVSVRDNADRPLPGATVSLVELGREGVTGEAGTYRFESVPDGAYHVGARLPGFAGTRAEVSVAGGAASVALTLGAQVHFTESVTVSPGGRDTFESYQPTSVLGAEDLQQRLGGSLGETLRTQVGVNVRAFGPGPARPVIRGLDGDRVLVLENGARTGDLSSQSGDHGVTLDPAGASQIEVVRGPATLLYGSNALGGVVNVVSDDIPTRPLEGLRGALTTQGGTVDDEAGLAGNVAFGDGRWAARINGSARRAGDTTTPAGGIPNSQSRTLGGGGAFGYAVADGYAGVSYQYVDTDYGVPYVEEGGTTLTPRRHRVDLRAERRNLGGFITGLKLRGGFRDYRHEEREADGAVATAFHNRFFEGQTLATHRPLGRLRGTFGVWAQARDYSSRGAEAPAPPTTQRTLAGFVYEELSFHHLALQVGGRVEHSRFEPDAAALPEREDLRARRFTSVSGSLGLLGHLREDLTLALNVARAVRNPSLEELYNFGPHAGNFAFEIGDPALPSEAGLGVDLSLRYRGPRVAAEATLFRNSIDRFIFAFQTGAREDGLPVVSFVSADSLLQGFELHADLGLSESLWLELGGDGVRGEVRATGEALPRMPPYRAWVGLRFQKDGFHVEGELRGAARQKRVYGAETATPGYALVNLHGSYTFTAGRSAHTLTLRLDNATARLYRNHLSYIKDLAPEPGRSLKLVYGVRF
jgi:iron complex outermembrane receptor protein